MKLAKIYVGICRFCGEISGGISTQREREDYTMQFDVREFLNDVNNRGDETKAINAEFVTIGCKGHSRRLLTKEELAAKFPEVFEEKEV